MSRMFAERSRCFLLLLVLIPVLALVGLAAPAQAQPFGAWLTLSGHPTHGYVRVPHSASLNPTGAFTFEAWVSITNSNDCRSIAGKNWEQAWWIGLCTVSGKPTLRSYLKGSLSQRNGGEIEPGRWTHIAVTFSGTHRRHYINGELAAEFAESGPLFTSTDELRIGSDTRWQFTVAGAIDEVRLWNVARTLSQIRDGMSHAITAPQGGLIAVWGFDGNVQDVVGPHDGSTQGAGIGFLTFPAIGSCGATTATTHCLLNRFEVSARWRTNPLPGTLTDGQAQVAGCANAGSGLFQFFSPNNWEIMVKALNGCGLNNN
jgi:Concanavalin A-like lectin/glucanases superfamily